MKTDELKELTSIPIDWWRMFEDITVLIDVGDGSAKPFERLRQAIFCMRDLLDFQAATVYLWDDDADGLVEKLVIGAKVELVDFLSFDGGPGASGWAMHEGQPLLLAQRRQGRPRENECTFGTFLSLPLVIGQTVLGVLNLGYDQERAISEPEVNRLNPIMSLMTLLIQQAQLRATSKHLRSELAKVGQELLNARHGLTALKKVARAAKTAEMVVHGINNPLSVIIGNVQCLIAERAVANQKGLGRLRRIEEAALEVAQVNRQLLKIHGMADDEALLQSTTQPQELRK